MISLVLLLLSQNTNVIIQNPNNPTKRATTTTAGSKEGLDVNVVGGGSSGDGGYTVVIQGAGADGGAAWGVSLQDPRGQATMALSIPVAIASNQSAVPVSGTVAATQGTSPWVENITQLGGNSIAVGSGASSTGTQRVILATDQPVVPVGDNGGSLTVDGTVAVSGTVAVTQSTSPWIIGDGAGAITVDGTVTANQGGAPWSVNQTQWNGVAVSVGSGASDTGTVRAILATNQPVIPVSDNAGSLTVDSTQLPAALVGGRLDENVGAWLGSTAPTVGQKAMASSVPVTIASNQAAVDVTVTGTSAQLPASNTAGAINKEGLGVNCTAVSSTIMAANGSRQGCSICLDIDATANVHLRFSAAASAATTSYHKLSPGQCAGCNWGNRVFDDAVTCISASGTQVIYMEEED